MYVNVTKPLMQAPSCKVPWKSLAVQVVCLQGANIYNTTDKINKVKEMQTNK